MLLTRLKGRFDHLIPDVRTCISRYAGAMEICGVVVGGKGGANLKASGFNSFANEDHR